MLKYLLIIFLKATLWSQFQQNRQLNFLTFENIYSWMPSDLRVYLFIQKYRSVSKKSEQLWASKRADARRQRCCKPLNLWSDIFLQFCLESSKELLPNRERLVFCVPGFYRTTAKLDRFTAPNRFIAMVSWRSYCSFFFSNLRFTCKYLKYGIIYFHGLRCKKERNQHVKNAGVKARQYQRWLVCCFFHHVYFLSALHWPMSH